MTNILLENAFVRRYVACTEVDIHAYLCMKFFIDILVDYVFNMPIVDSCENELMFLIMLDLFYSNSLLHLDYRVDWWLKKLIEKKLI